MKTIALCIVMSITLYAQNKIQNSFVIVENFSEDYKNYNIFIARSLESETYFCIISKKQEVSLKYKVIEKGDTLNIPLKECNNTIVLDPVMQNRSENEVEYHLDDKLYSRNDTLFFKAYMSNRIIDKYVID